MTFATRNIVRLTIEGPVADFAEWQVASAVAAGMEQLGWSADDASVRELLPPIRRGTSVVAVLPPSPAWASPVAGALSSGLREGGGRVLVLTAPALVAEWGATFAAVAGSSGMRIEAARGPARAARRIKADAVDVLIASPDTALALHTRSALDTDRISTIVLAWPEGWDADEALLVLLQDLPKDAQRIVLTADAGRSADLVERYARRAAVFGVPSETADTTPVAAVRTLPTPWAGRAAAVAALLEATDPHRVTIWTADRRDHATLRAALGGLADDVLLVARERPESGSVICYDPPSLEALRELAESGEVTLLVPPGAEVHVARIAATRRPVMTESATTSLLQRDASLRAQVTAILDDGPDAAALYALGPLFERWEPQQVAAALFRLWQDDVRRKRPADAPSAPTTTPVGGVHTSRIWMGVGKKDEATVGDIVAVLAREVGLDRSLIGRVDLRDAFTLVEVPSSEAERVALKLVGLTVRKRKLSARVDRGPSGPSGPSRGGGGGGFGGARSGGGAGAGGGRPPFKPRG